MNINHLLSQVRIIQQKYEEIEILKKEKFNIFKILGVQTEEVKLHSRFLAELLNPNGSHLMGSLFLDLWLAEALPNFNFSRKNIKVEIEKTIPTGRRLDIIISNDDNQCIIIENKIYAPDQERQMYDYHQYAKNYREFRLLYLNLLGKEPSKSSIHTLQIKKDFACISYHEHICNWLEKCQKEAFDYPIIRETLKQYQFTLHLLTNKNNNNNYMQELSNILSRDQNYLVVEDINEAYKLLKINALSKVFSELADALKAEGLQIEVKFGEHTFDKAAAIYYSSHSQVKFSNFTIATKDPNLFVAIELNQTFYIILLNANLQHIDAVQRETAHSKNTDLKWIREGQYYYTRPNITNASLNFLNPTREDLSIYIDDISRKNWTLTFAAEIKRIVNLFD